MSRLLHTLVPWLLALGASLPLPAAEPASAASEPAQETPATPDESTMTTAERDAALAEEIRAAEAAAASAPAADSNDTFVPSVQVSEDLSVSFPVDI